LWLVVQELQVVSRLVITTNVPSFWMTISNYL
jgi:hypothetical protein